MQTTISSLTIMSKQTMSSRLTLFPWPVFKCPVLWCTQSRWIVTGLTRVPILMEYLCFKCNILNAACALRLAEIEIEAEKSVCRRKKKRQLLLRKMLSFLKGHEGVFEHLLTFLAICSVLN